MMDNSRKTEFIKSGCLFAFIPIIATYLLGHAFKFLFSDTIQSAAELPVEDPDRMFLPQIEIVFPFAIISGCVALVVWTALMYKKASTVRGICAGLLTVFSCYPILGFAMGWFYPDIAVTGRLGSAIDVGFSLTLFGNIMSFGLTYPLGGLCGWLIAKKSRVWIPQLTPTYSRNQYAHKLNPYFKRAEDGKKLFLSIG